MIKKVKRKYLVIAESGRHMGTYTSLKAAKKRLQQIEYFKHAKGRGRKRGKPKS